MTVLTLVTADKVNIVETNEQLTLPAAEAITAGDVIRIDTSTGKFTKGNGTSTAEARGKWVSTKTVVAGQGLTGIKKGVMDGWDLSGLAYDADVYMSDTDGKLDTAAGTVSTKVGRVIAGTGTTLGTAYDKLLMVDL